jgi:coproporphyrinogen III oxidase-like Fe-S oxidoreductase
LFAAAPPVQPADEIVDDMLDRSLRTLEAAGFAQYEVSGYARRDALCVHNLNYWTFGDYLGIGAGAHGKISRASSGEIVRTTQLREPRRYLAAEPGAFAKKIIPAGELPFEFAMNGLRLVEGFGDDLFAARTGLDPQVLTERLAPIQARGLLERTPGHWRATPQGFRFLNEILVELLPDAGIPGPNPDGMPRS